MPITSVEKDLDALTMTVTADFAASRQRLWEAYTDPRQIERFWGPAEWPATFTRHDVFVGGRSSYFMTGPDGERSSGFWEFLAVDEGRLFEVRDGFADADGEENTDMPSMRMTFLFEDIANGSRLVTTTRFGSLNQLEQLIEMGMEEGMKSAMGQIDAVLADLQSFAAGRGTELQVLSDTQIRVTRIIRGTVEQVWGAHHEPDLMKQWLLGPDGWTMPVCEVATEVGETYRYEWEPESGHDGERFGFVGEMLESDPPRRSVVTEQMIGIDGSTTNELTLTPRNDGKTLLSIVTTYPNAEVRDIVLATGMVDGMESSYARLETVLR
ncbi:MAG: ATPase [Acidimicrobiales bacterium]|nr:ATPase [Acidimicrobiales bacterium]